MGCWVKAQAPISNKGQEHTIAVGSLGQVLAIDDTGAAIVFQGIDKRLCFPASALGSLSIVPSPGEGLHAVRRQAGSASVGRGSAGGVGPVPLGGGALGGAAPARLMMGRLVDADGRIVLSPSSTLGSLSIVPSPGDRLHTVRQQADATSMSQESAGQARPAPTNRGAMGGAAPAAAGATASGAAETLAGTDASTEGDATGAGPVVGAQNVPPVYKQQHTDAGAGGDRLAPLVQGGRSSAATAQEPGPVRQHADATSMSQESAEEARPAPSTCGALGGAASAAAGATASGAAEILAGTDAGTEGEIHKHQHNLGKAQECSAFSETLALKACKYRPTKEAILSARKTVRKHVPQGSGAPDR